MLGVAGGIDLTLVAIGFGIAIFFGALALALRPILMVDRNAVRRKSEILERHRPTVEGQHARAIVKQAEEGGAERMAKRLLPNQRQLKQRLDRTGRSISLGRYLGVSVVSAISAAVTLQATLAPAPIFVLLAAVVGGVGLPYLVVGRMGSRRLHKFTLLFPDAIDLMVRGLKSGLPPAESFRTVAVEIPAPVGTEFQKIADGLRLGQTPDQVLWEAAKRIDTPEFKFFVISMSIQRETGGNLIETLHNLSDILRKRRQLKLKVKAMSSEARASAYIIGSLPFVMFGIIRAIAPGYTDTLITDPRGLVMTGVGLTMIGMGAAVMMKMVNFDH